MLDTNVGTRCTDCLRWAGCIQGCLSSACKTRDMQYNAVLNTIVRGPLSAAKHGITVCDTASYACKLLQVVKGRAEALAKAQYARRKDPHDCALMYVALQRKQLLLVSSHCSTS